MGEGVGRPMSPEYVAYIASPAWRAKRREALARANNCCQYYVEDPSGIAPPRTCTRTRYLTVHHATYERLGDELPQDIEVLCWFHHMIEHLMQVTCGVCGGPVLVWYDGAEAWLALELESLGIDLDSGPVNWKTLPHKDQLVELLAELTPYCDECDKFI